MRKEILDIIIAEQKELINNLKEALATYNSSTNSEDEIISELGDQAHQSDIQSLKIEVIQKLNFEEANLKKLQSLRLREPNELREGAVIETKDNIYFVGLAFPPIKHNDKKILGFSTMAPAYQNNQGKKKGDTLVLGNIEAKIENIY